MKIRKRFVVEVEFSSTDGCGNPQDVTAGTIRRSLEHLQFDNLSINVKKEGGDE